MGQAPRQRDGYVAGRCFTGYRGTGVPSISDPTRTASAYMTTTAAAPSARDSVARGPRIESRLLLGPGPSPVHERILEALARPTVGHLDPQFLALMDQVNEGLRRVFGTKNQMTFPVSGTGSAAMEAALANVVEPGDTV